MPRFFLTGPDKRLDGVKLQLVSRSCKYYIALLTVIPSAGLAPIHNGVQHPFSERRQSTLDLQLSPTTGC